MQSTADASTRLLVCVGDRLLDLPDASRDSPEQILAALLRAFLHVPVSRKTLTVAKLSSQFGSAIRASRKRAPYRLQALYDLCLSQKIDDSTLEARVFRYGGAHALTALCAAATHDNGVSQDLQNLDARDLESFVQSLNEVEPHSDFVGIVGRLQGGHNIRPAGQKKTKKLAVPGKAARTKREFYCEPIDQTLAPQELSQSNSLRLEEIQSAASRAQPELACPGYLTPLLTDFSDMLDSWLPNSEADAIAYESRLAAQAEDDAA